jgi:adenylate cyclase, class 2
VQYEVEQKFRVTDLRKLEEELRGRGAAIGTAVVQIDHYFRHPARDFAKTDEALRIRSIGDEHFITYKGPKIDQATKTRKELELPLGTGERTLRDFRQLLEALGFTQVREVKKTRRLFELDWEGSPIDVALDHVDKLGEFIELEIVAEQSGVDSARRCILSLAQRLGLESPERRSYLEMLLEGGN